MKETEVQIDSIYQQQTTIIFQKSQSVIGLVSVTLNKSEIRENRKPDAIQFKIRGYLHSYIKHKRIDQWYIVTGTSRSSLTGWKEQFLLQFTQK